MVAASKIDDLIRTCRSSLFSNKVKLMGKTTEVELEEGGKESFGQLARTKQERERETDGGYFRSVESWRWNEGEALERGVSAEDK